jgi:hypothetical protein
MLPFNNLKFFSMPQLPPDWEAPQWLKTELGLLAGRLYFEWDEYEALCQFLGVDETGPLDDESSQEEEEAEDDDNDFVVIDGDAGTASSTITAQNRTKRESSRERPTLFAPRPLVFLQEWLAVRRHGQDFVHTPMGFIIQGKPLQADHYFFSETLSSALSTAVGDGLATGLGFAEGLGKTHDGDGGDDGAVFDVIDDMGANVGESGSDDDWEEDSEGEEESESEIGSEGEGESGSGSGSEGQSD